MAVTGDEFIIPIGGKDRSSKIFEKIGDNALKMAKDAGLAAVAINQAFELIGKASQFIQRTFNATVGEFGDFQQGLVGVQKTTNLSNEAIERVGLQVQALAMRIPVATDSLLEIAQAAGQLGVTGADNILLFTETIAKLESASDLSGDAAATALTRVLTVTGESIQNIDELASVIVRLGNNFAATESQIVRVTSEVARATSVFGVSSHEAAALATTFAQLDVRAELAGSSVGRAFNTINKAIQDGGAQFERLQELTGLTGDALRQTFVDDATEVFQKFIEALGKIPAQQIGTELEFFDLKGQEVLKTLPVLATRADVFADALRQANDEVANATALNEEAARAFDTLNSDMQLLSNAIKILAQNIGSIFAPAVRGIVNVVTDAINSVSDFFVLLNRIDFADIAKSILNVTVAVGGMTIAVKASTAAWGLLSTSIAGFTGAGVALNISLLSAALTKAAKGAAVAASGFALAAAKIVAVGAAVGIIFAAIDIVVRNLGQLDKVLALLGDGFLLLVNKAQQAMQDVVIFIGEGITNLMVELNRLGVVSNEELTKALQDQQRLFQEQGDLLEEQVRLSERIKRNAEGIDFGFAGQIAGFIMDSAEGTAAAQAKAAEEAEKAAKAQREQVEALAAASAKAKELANALFGIQNENIALLRDIESINAGVLERIDLQAEAALSTVDAKQRQLEQEEKLTDEIQTQLDLQRQLIVEAAEAQKNKALVDARNVLLFDEDQLLRIEEVLGSGGKSFADGLMGFAAAPLAFADAANSILDGIQKLIDFIPDMLNKIANIFTSLTELPMKIVEGFTNIFDGITGFIKDFIPNLIDGIGDLIMGALDFLVEGLPDAIASLAEKIPEALSGLIERLPEIANKMGQAFATNAPFIAQKFALSLATKVPMLVVELIKKAPDIALALVDGFVNGLKEAANDIANLLGFDDIFDLGDDIGAKFAEVGDTVSRSASRLFEVVDLEAAARGLDVADRIRDAISSSTNRVATLLERLFNFLKGIWENIVKPIVDALIDGLKFIWEQIILPIVNTLVEGLKWLWENVILPIAEMLVDGLKFVWEEVILPIVDALVDGLKFIWENVILPIIDTFVNALTTVWQFVVDKIITPLKDGFDWIFDLVFAVTDLIAGFDWVGTLDSIRDAFVDGFTWVTDLVDGISDLFEVPGWVQDFIDAVSSITNFGGFSTGGLVTNVGNTIANAAGSAGDAISSAGSSVGRALGLAEGGPVGNVIHLDTARRVAESSNILYAQTGSLASGTDTVPAMLTPGEFVVNRDSTKSNLSLLNTINSAKGEVRPVERPTNISVVVNAKTNLSADQIRREVVPAIERQLKRKSQEGAFVISERGIRK